MTKYLETYEINLDGIEEYLREFDIMANKGTDTNVIHLDEHITNGVQNYALAILVNNSVVLKACTDIKNIGMSDIKLVFIENKQGMRDTHKLISRGINNFEYKDLHCSIGESLKNMGGKKTFILKHHVIHLLDTGGSYSNRRVVIKVERVTKVESLTRRIKKIFN